jgi:signal transduction histidine kinase
MRRREVSISPSRRWTTGIAVESDRQLLGSAVSNLLQNAFKLMPPHGHVSLRARKAGDHVLIEVEDESGGLPPGKADELFRPFDERADKTGLGTRSSHQPQGRGRERRRDPCGENEPGKGCVFTIEIELPIAA